MHYHSLPTEKGYPMQISATARQALMRAKKARLIHCPGQAYFGAHLAILTTDAHDQPAFLSGPDGGVILFATAPEADALLRPLVPDLELEVDDYCLRPPAMVLP